mmetsp:Transcript_16812/g.67844  ORF Transcript_16812/g.67844 Transcript_16812/m.67844 type:complete len:309 (+) Transcript_16812:233-1159(+)
MRPTNEEDPRRRPREAQPRAHLRRRMPRPPWRPMRPCMPPPPRPIAAAVRRCWSASDTPEASAAPGCSDWGFCTVSSMTRTSAAASAAAASALYLLEAGSQMWCASVSTTPSWVQSTPNHSVVAVVPRAASAALACFWRSALSTSVGSKPEFAASCRGMTSSAFATAAKMSCSLPWISSAWSRNAFESAISTAPPPPTTRDDSGAVLDCCESPSIFLGSPFFSPSAAEPASAAPSAGAADESVDSCPADDAAPPKVSNPLVSSSSSAARLAIMRASWIERCDSSMNCSEPPRRTMVYVLALGQSVNTL